MRYNFYHFDYFNKDFADSWLQLFEKLNFNYKNSAIDILELGSAVGSSACWMSDNLLDHKDSTLTCVDKFIERRRTIFLQNIMLSKNYEKIIVEMDFTQRFMFKNTKRYDLIYLDSSWFDGDTIFYGFFAEKYLKEKGIVIFDDDLLEDVHKGIEFLKEHFKMKEIELNDKQRAFIND